MAAEMAKRFGPWAFALALAVWTVLLLIPVPDAAKRPFGGPDAEFLASKLTHVGTYAALTAAAAVLLPPGRVRWLALAVLVGHGFLTEYLQAFVGRGSSLRDALLDGFGTGLGFLATRRRWLAPRPAADPA